MTTTKLESGYHLKITTPVPRRGLVSFEVAAEQPVDTYVVDEEGLKEFYAGKKKFSYYGGFPARRLHKQTLRLPFRGDWYLLVVNKNPDDIEVEYDIH